MVQAWLLASAITSAGIEGADVAREWSVLVALAAVILARATVAWAQELVARLCSASVKSKLRLQLLRRAAGDAAKGRSAAGSAETVALATRGLDALDAYFARYLPQLMLSAIVPVAVIACLVAVDLVSALIVIVTVPLIPLFMVLIGSATERRRRRRWNALAVLSHHFLDVVTGLATLRVFGQAGPQLGRLQRVTDEYRRESLGTLRVAFLSAFALELAATLSVALVAVGVGLRLVDGLTDLRTGLFVVILAPEAYLPLRQLGASFHASEEGLGASDAAFRIIEPRGEVEPGTEGTPALGDTGSPGRAPLPRPGPDGFPSSTSSAAGNIGRSGGAASPSSHANLRDPQRIEVRVEGVTVRQPERDLEAPCRATLQFRAGEVVGIAGPSGAGKTSLLETILGLRNPDAGRVAVADAEGTGVDVRALDADEWHAAIAWVPQRPYCFPGTVAENIRLVAPGATDASIAEALRAVALDGLDPATVLGEEGSGISSGQRRRLAVARALLRGSPVVLLDEPTAGLDEVSERRVLEAVRDAAHRDGRAVLLVAHRPAALAVADRIVNVSSRSLEPA